MSIAAGTLPHRHRMRRIDTVTDAALARLGVADLLVELLDRVVELLGVETPPPCCC
jgi:hypothetical protein